MSSENVIKKKIKPYPFECVLTGKTQPTKAQIVKLTDIGFLATVGRDFFKAHDVLQVDFLLPVSKDAVCTQAKVVATYDKYKNADGTNSRLVEMHFTHLPEDQSKSIYKFLVAIRQIKG